MVDILVRNIHEETARRLKDNAAANGASVNETARLVNCRICEARQGRTHGEG